MTFLPCLSPTLQVEEPNKMRARLSYRQNSKEWTDTQAMCRSALLAAVGLAYLLLQSSLRRKSSYRQVSISNFSHGAVLISLRTECGVSHGVSWIRSRKRFQVKSDTAS